MPFGTHPHFLVGDAGKLITVPGLERSGARWGEPTVAIRGISNCRESDVWRVQKFMYATNATKIFRSNIPIILFTAGYYPDTLLLKKRGMYFMT
jgi:hypothetical protein